MKFPFFKKEKDIIEKVELEPEEISIQDIVAPPSVEIKENCLKLGERLAKTFFIFSYPRYLSTGWISPAVNLNFPLDISIHIHPVDSGRVLRQLRKKLTEIQAELIEREEKGLIRDPTLEIAYKDIEKLRDALQRAEERVFRLGVYLTIYGDSPKELRETETRLRSIFESRLIYLKPTLLREKEGFISTAPYGLDQILVHTPMNTAPLSSIFPFVSPDLSANEGILYGINKHNNSLVLFDRFTLENANMVLFAKSGAGKSITYHTPVLIKKGRKIQLIKIGALVEEILQTQGVDFWDRELEGKTFPGVYVWTFDRTLKAKWGKVKIAARKKAPKVLYYFKTKTGREITTTGDHNLVILKNGKIVLTKASEVKEGEFVPLPKKIAKNPTPQFLNLLELLKESKNIYLKKRIPSFIFSLKICQIAQYLSAYFERNGKIEKNQIIICSESKKLVSDLGYLLLYFGIIAHLSKLKKKFTNYRWKLSINGGENLKKFASYIGFISKEKKRKLRKIIEKKEGDVFFSQIFKPIEFQKTIGLYQPGLIFFKNFNPVYQTIQGTVQNLWQNFPKILLEKISQREKELKISSESDLFWDPIIEIKKIKNKKEKYVYDLTCENGVFLAGEGGMFVHNSYFCKLEILRYLMQGVKVIVIDPENEYQWLAEAVDGSFFQISLTSPHHLNPFDLPIVREDEKPEDVLRSNVINLVGLFRIMLGGLTPKEDAIIDRAITETYAAHDITPQSDPLKWKEKIPLISDFQTVLEGMEGTEALVERVRKFTTGSYAQFFNNPTNVSMDKDLVIFGIRDMEDELRPMAMFIILRYIWNAIRSSLEKRILLVDEAWWIMQSEEGASFLYGVCKRARKYWLGVTTITQDVSDFMKSDYGKPIITNSSLQFLLKQSPAAIEVIQKTFNLTEEEKYLLLECDVGEGIFIAGQKRVALKVIASYAEDQIITSSPEEVKKIKEAKKRLKG